MGTENWAQRQGARLSHPLLALLIAAIAAIGAISQCGLLLDAAAASRGADGTAVQALSGVPAMPAESPHVAAAPRSVVPSAPVTRPN